MIGQWGMVMRLVSLVLIVGLLALAPATHALAKTKSKPAESSAPAINLDAGARYFAPTIETTSSALAYHDGTGLHVAYAGFGGESADEMTYAHCVEPDCTAPDAWQSVALPLPRAVKVQLALTPRGQPRILGAGWSGDQANGTDWFYAECDRDCLDAKSWTIGKVISTADGLMSNISRSRLAERTFALDEYGHPRFVVADSNYVIEPDHYGAFFMSCERDCTRATSWTETNLANQSGYSTESFSYPVLALAPGGKARLIANVYAFDENGEDLEDGLYYYQCDEDCTTRDNWSRTRVIERGYGSYPDPSWDMKVLPDGRPRLAFFAGQDMTDAGLSRQLIYAWCDEGCTSGEGDNWFGYPLGVGDDSGESPSLMLDSKGVPQIAFVTSGHELGYAKCIRDCEVSEKAAWNADFAEASAVAAADRPTALPYTCDGEVWNAMSPSLALVRDQPFIGYELSVEARCLYKEIGEPEISYQFHEIWRGTRLVRPALPTP